MLNSLSRIGSGRCFFRAWLLVAAFFSFVPVSIAETPEQFLRSFSDFKFKFHEKIQSPDVFLSSKSGDCDDFATLAAAALAQSGYETQLFAVRMKGETHVVCYVPKIQGYLDFNNRAAADPIVPTNGSTQDIASKVSASFNRKWIAAYEFSYRDNAKWLVSSIVQNAPARAGLLATR